MKLYIIRHGQTDNNIQGKINGHNNQQLNEAGIEQAKEASKKIAQLEIDLIISSPIVRTVETTNIININRIPVILNKNLVERDSGDYTNIKISEIDEDDWWNLYPKNDYSHAESVLKVYDRISRFLDDLKLVYPKKKILLVTHGGVFKAIDAYFNGIPENGDFNKSHSGNCELREYEL